MQCRGVLTILYRENSLNQHGKGRLLGVLRLALSRIRSLGLAQEAQVHFGVLPAATTPLHGLWLTGH
jgi:hypothetical protein